LDTARRKTERRDTSGWVQPGPTTFPHQGWIGAGRLAVLAPGLPEAELGEDGVLALTLVRSVGWLSRPDLVSRPGEAGPCLATPGAQVLDDFEANISLTAATIEDLPATARAVELGFKAVAAGPEPLHPPDLPLLRVAPSTLQLSALKPSEDGRGLVIRILNPNDESTSCRLSLGFDCEAATTIRLDETPTGEAASFSSRSVETEIGPHALCTLLILPAPSTARH
jgi:mannosylglycerate hydrolase